MTTAMTAAKPTALGPAWDAFQLMDRLDEQALIKEMEGIAVRDLVYVVKDGKEEVVGLSKVGVDECCRELVRHGQVVRETELAFQMIGEGENAQGVFTAKAARFALNPNTAQEVKLDEVLGVKRQALYEERAALTLDSRVPGKKWKGHTYRELLEREDGREYLEWMAENFKEEHIRDFTRRILDGEDVGEQAAGKRFNPHWYEHGAMKACRNARIRLIPLNVQAQIIALARQEGRAKVVDRSGEEVNGDGAGERPAKGGLSPAAKWKAPVKTLDDALAFPLPWPSSPLANTPLGELRNNLLWAAVEWCEKGIKKSKDAGETVSLRVQNLYAAAHMILEARERGELEEPPKPPGEEDPAQAKLFAEEGEQRPDPTSSGASALSTPTSTPSSSPTTHSGSNTKRESTTSSRSPGSSSTDAPDPTPTPGAPSAATPAPGSSPRSNGSASASPSSTTGTPSSSRTGSSPTPTPHAGSGRSEHAVPDPAASPFRANTSDDGREALETLEQTPPDEASAYDLGRVIRDAIEHGPFEPNERKTLKKLFTDAGTSATKLAMVRTAVLNHARELPF